jgi:hypothetical protein
MHVAGGVHRALATHQVDAVAGQDGVGLRNDGIAGDDEAVGLVVVDEVAAGYIDRPAGMARLIGTGEPTLRASDRRRKQRQQRCGGESAQQ